MRTFVALDLDDLVRERIARFLDGVRGFAPDVRWVQPESLHVTLKFVGEKPLPIVEGLKAALDKVESDAFPLAFHGYGFFPTAKSARVFWIGIDAGPELVKLATVVDDAIAAMGIPREDRAFSPHLTLARGGSGSGAPGRQKGDQKNASFRKLQEQLAAMPALDFGAMNAHAFFLYQSELGRGGARYTKIARFALRTA